MSQSLPPPLSMVPLFLIVPVSMLTAIRSIPWTQRGRIVYFPVCPSVPGCPILLTNYRRSSKGAHKSFLVLSIAALMFMMTSALWIAQVIGAIIYTRAYLMVTGDQMAKALYSVDVITKVQHCIFGTSVCLSTTLILIVLISFQIAFGDSLIVWRVWTIFPENKIIRISTVVLLLTTVGALSTLSVFS